MPALQHDPLAALKCPKFIPDAVGMATVLDLYSAAMPDAADSSGASVMVLCKPEWAVRCCPDPLKQWAAAQNDACTAQQLSCSATYQISATLLTAQECLANGWDHHIAQQPWTDFISMLALLQRPTTPSLHVHVFTQDCKYVCHTGSRPKEGNCIVQMIHM